MVLISCYEISLVFLKHGILKLLHLIDDFIYCCVGLCDTLSGLLVVFRKKLHKIVQVLMCFVTSRVFTFLVIHCEGRVTTRVAANFVFRNTEEHGTVSCGSSLSLLWKKLCFLSKHFNLNYLNILNA